MKKKEVGPLSLSISRTHQLTVKDGRRSPLKRYPSLPPVLNSTKIRSNLRYQTLVTWLGWTISLTSLWTGVAETLSMAIQLYKLP